ARPVHTVPTPGREALELDQCGVGQQLPARDLGGDIVGEPLASQAQQRPVAHQYGHAGLGLLVFRVELADSIQETLPYLPAGITARHTNVERTARPRPAQALLGPARSAVGV